MINKIIENFFNFDLPCPPEIPLCEQVRNSYKQELQKLEVSPGCSGCAIGKLKSRFVEAVWKEVSANFGKSQ